jgi:hypothetical protein
MDLLNFSDGLINLQNLAEALGKLPEDKAVPIVLGKAHSILVLQFSQSSKSQDSLAGVHRCLVPSVIGVALTISLKCYWTEDIP